MKQMQILRELSVENRNFDILFKGKKTIIWDNSF